MGYQVLARKYRPQRFSDVAGQDHVTRTLLNALSQNRIAHGYIFSGHRGIGKTTIARILAMALNCRTAVGTAERPTHEPCLHCFSCREISSGGNPESGEQAMHSFDFIEIDAASNRGIDDVRSIRSQASVQPARDKYKIFLLDEAHQITEAAFNAILKTLEEPPEWTIFMMATTEPENIPQTIRSRCQHFSFHAVKFEDILGQLRMVATKEQVQAEDAALALLAEAGDGSMRDALSIMDQAIASAPCNEAGHAVLAADQIRDLMGSVPNAVFERLLEAVAAGQSAELMEQLNVLLSAGHSPSSLARQMVRYLRNALMAKIGGEQTELLQISTDERARAVRSAMLFSEEDLTRNLQIVLRTFDDLNYRQEQRFHLELGLLKLVHAQRLLPLEELLSGVAGGVAPSRGTSAPPTRSGSTASAPAGPSSGSRASSPFGGNQPSRTTPSPSEPPSAPKPAAPPNSSASAAAPSTSPFGGAWPPLPKQSSAPGSEMQRPASTAEAGKPGPAPQQTRPSPFGPLPPFGTNGPSVATLPVSSPAVAEKPALVAQSAVAVAEPESELSSAATESGSATANDRASAAEGDAAKTTLSALEPANPGTVESKTQFIQPEVPVPTPEPAPFPGVTAATAMGFDGSPAEAADSLVAEAAATAAASGGENAEIYRDAIVSALANGGHASASQLLGAGNWVLDQSILRIEVAGMGKKMLSLTVNAAAEKIIRQELQRLGGPGRFMVVPGEGGAGSTRAAAATPRAGSIEEEALRNPMVQRAKEIFQADVRSVVDLRAK